MPSKCQANQSTTSASESFFLADAIRLSRSSKVVLLLVVLRVGCIVAADRSISSVSGSFCGQSSFEDNFESGSRPRRSVELTGSSESLASSSQTADENDRPIIDSNVDDCGRRRRRQSVGQQANSRQNPQRLSPDHNCITNESSSSSSPQESSNETASEPIKTIETAVFIDQALDNRFNGLSGGLVELNKLVLTIMNQVQHLFRFSSLQVPIKIKLVLIEHLRESERNGFGSPDNGRGDIDVYLSNFCNWQQSRLERAGGQRLAWDHAILLSGLDLYKATPQRNQSGVLGLAWVGGMCKGNYSCTVNEAANFESAFVIAHELGHSLGIMHDGQRNGCNPNGFIMSERTGAGKVNWSKCSNKYLNQSIARKQLQCLDVESSELTDSMYDLAKLRAPGQTYTINEQCKLAFGNNYTSFVTRQQPFNNVCRELWCVAGTWAKAAHPALEASACADQERTCREGKCAAK